MDSSTSPELPDRLSAMLARQRELQERFMLHGGSFGDLTVFDRVRYLKDMVLALDNELHAEVLHEFTWKPWDHSQPTIHEEHLFRELVDVWHFLMNMLWATYPNDTPGELSRRLFVVYTDKWQVNVQRQERGYLNDDKCPHCGRALDDVGTAIMPGVDGVVTMCLGCRDTFFRGEKTA